jgi:putative transposase
LGSRSRATTGGGGPKIDQARRLKELERENQRLKKAVSDLTRDKLILKEALEGKY